MEKQLKNKEDRERWARQQHGTEHNTWEDQHRGSEQVTTNLLIHQVVELMKKFDQHQQPTTIIQRQPLRIPTFDGEPENFKSYWTRFNSLIHDDPSISTAEKVNMLYEGLKGKARTVVNVDPTVENYGYIRTLMEKEYGTHKTDTYRLLIQLQAIKPATYKARECERVHREIKATLRRIETAGTAITKPMIVSQVLTKFPFKLVKKLIMEADEKTGGELMDGLHDKLRTFKLEEEKEFIHRQTFESKPKAERPTSNKEHTDSKNQCAFCNRRYHTAEQCRQYSTPEERRQLIRERKQCWICFSNTHNSRNCTEAKCEQCNLEHNKLLCIMNSTQRLNNGVTPKDRNSNEQKKNWTTQPRRGANEETQTQRRPPQGKGMTQLLTQSNTISKDSDNDSSTTDSSSTSEDERIILHSKNKKSKRELRTRVILKTAVIMVYNHETREYEQAEAIIDEGSTRSMITEETAQSLNLPIKKTATRTFFGIGGLEETHESHEVPIKVKTPKGTLKLMVSTKPKITVAIRAPILSKEDSSWIEQQGWTPANPKINGERVTPRILIGMDNYTAITQAENKENKLPSGLLAKQMKIGTVIYGVTSIKPRARKEVSLFLTNNTEEREKPLEEIARELFQIDNLGIDPNEEKEQAITEAYYNEYAQTIRYQKDRLIAPFPKKENISLLADNKGVAIRRLHCLKTQLQKNKEQSKWYNKIMDDYISEGVVEKVPRYDTNTPKYYIPHHGVWKPGKEKPLRIVFDASSKSKGSPSLNDVIATGSIFINKIHDIIVANRFHKIIIMCDIEAAFTQIMLTAADKDLCRFFWTETINGQEQISAYRFCRLPFGVTSSPSILNMCLTHFLKKEQSDLAEEILKLLYVDNITMGAEDEESAIQKIIESKTVFRKISMNLREYITNNSIVNDQIAEKDRLEEHKVKMLGLPFNTRRDEITTQVKLEQCDKLTKRIMLSQLHKSYDPIGIITPLLLQIKLHLRNVFNNKSGWDEVLDEDTTKEWNILVEKATPANVSIARYIPLKNSSVLWIFADASKEATAVCAYIQTDSEISDILTGKVKLAPKRSLTIPKLELIAIRMAFNLAKSLIKKQRMDSCRIKIASDSHIALDWLSSQKKLHRSIEHYTADIINITQVLEENGNKVELYHVATEYNPADIGTRGMEKEDCDHSPWIKGPQWINGKVNPLTPFQMRKEIIKEEVPNDIILFQEEVEMEDDITEACLKTENHKRNMATAAYIGKFIKAIMNIKGKSPQYLQGLTPSTGITEEDNIAAQNLLIYLAQRKDNLDNLKEKYKSWNFIKDDKGIIRIETRLQNADLPYDTKNPIWLPRKSPLAEYIIKQTHKKCGHQGRELVHTILRQRYYLPKPMATIRKVLKSCTRCTRYHALPIGSPQMANLPKDRVTLTRPFAATGCDLMGPFTLQGEGKTHVCLFTCMATRAIHLEIVPTTSTESFLNALQRFTARRGVPEMIRSDNGSNFVLGNKILTQIINERRDRNNPYKDFMHLYHLEKVKWIFNTPLAPWKGGAWERLIGIVKSSFNKAIGRYKPSLDELHTIMTKIEAIVNNRPMTASISDDPEVIPIRPIDFLNMAISYSIPDQLEREELEEPGQDPEFINSSKQAMEAIQFIATITSRFWHRWKTEYLTAIKDINRKTKNQGRHCRHPIKQGDIVIIKTEKALRGAWQLGRIIRLEDSEDGLTRSAVIWSKGREIKRSLELVYPLEISDKTPTARSTWPIESAEEQTPGEDQERNIKEETIEESETEEEETPPRRHEDSDRESTQSRNSNLEIDMEDAEEDELQQEEHDEGVQYESVRTTKPKEPTSKTLDTSKDNPTQTTDTSLIKPSTKEKPTTPQQNDDTWINELPRIMEQAKRRLEERKNLTCAPPRRESAFKNFLTMTCLLSIVTTVNGTTTAYCNGSHLTITPDGSPALLCIDSDCQNLGPRNKTPKIIHLEALPGKNLAYIKLITVEGTETTRCSRGHTCHKARFMTRNLLGNPHCWPLGAQLSAFIYITLISAIILPIGRSIYTSCKNSKMAETANQRWTQSKEMIKNFKEITRNPQLLANPGTEENNNRRIWHTQEPREHLRQHYWRQTLDYPFEAEEEIKQNDRTSERKGKRKPAEPARILPRRPLRYSAYMTAVITLSTITISQGCQDTHTRYVTELKCDNRTNCYYQFGREIMFNSLTSKICVQMMHNNAPIGSMEIEKMNSTLTCVKEHLHYSRMTGAIVETKKRCKFSGSCSGDFCEEVTKGSYLKEFEHTFDYNGEAGCMWSCGGWLCGCGMIFSRGCSFYRLYHKPITDEIFDVFRCAEFFNEVTFKIDIIIRKQKSTQFIRMRPYQKIITPFLNVTISSITNQYSPITSNRFARSDKRTIMLDNHDEFMLKCNNKDEARANQKACSLADKCKCRPHEHSTTCECPVNAIKKHEQKQTLPVNSSAMELKEHGQTIVALQKTDEILLYMESNLLMDSASMNLDYPCAPTFLNITGCYDCPDGAKISLSCMSTIDSWITIQCEDNIRSIECAPTNPRTEITMYFSDATVYQECSTKCANERKDFTISGTLQYHEPDDDVMAAEQPDKEWTRLPDLNPLGSTLINRWKTSALLTGATVVTTLTSYAFGAQALTTASKPLIGIIAKAAVVSWKIASAVIKALL